MITHDQCQAWESEVSHLREKLGEALEESESFKSALIDLLELVNDHVDLKVYFGSYNHKHYNTVQKIKRVPHVTE